MNGRTAKLLARYARAMTVYDPRTGEALTGPKVRDLKREWLSRSGRERAVMRRRMEARVCQP